MVICDDFTAADRALRVFAVLARQWEFRLDPVVWRFAQLNTAQNQRRVTDGMADADFVVVSFSRPHLVPGPIEEWIEMCVSAKRARSTTWLSHAGKNDGWTISFVDAHGTLTPRPEIPAFLVRPAPVTSTRRPVRYRKSGNGDSRRCG